MANDKVQSQPSTLGKFRPHAKENCRPMHVFCMVHFTGNLSCSHTELAAIANPVPQATAVLAAALRRVPLLTTAYASCCGSFEHAQKIAASVAAI